MRTTNVTTKASERRGAVLARVAAESAESVVVLAPNKPMVPTAPSAPDDYPLAPPRRHIGQPLDSTGRRTSRALGRSSKQQHAIRHPMTEMGTGG